MYELIVLRLDLEYEERKKRRGRAHYDEARSWQDVWHGLARTVASFWQTLGSCFLLRPIRTHLRKEAVCAIALIFLVYTLAVPDTHDQTCWQAQACNHSSLLFPSLFMLQCCKAADQGFGYKGPVSLNRRWKSSW